MARGRTRSDRRFHHEHNAELNADFILKSLLTSPVGTQIQQRSRQAVRQHRQEYSIDEMSDQGTVWDPKRDYRAEHCTVGRKNGNYRFPEQNAPGGCQIDIGIRFRIGP